MTVYQDVGAKQVSSAKLPPQVKVRVLIRSRTKHQKKKCAMEIFLCALIAWTIFTLAILEEMTLEKSAGENVAMAGKVSRIVL